MFDKIGIIALGITVVWLFCLPLIHEKTSIVDPILKVLGILKFMDIDSISDYNEFKYSAFIKLKKHEEKHEEKHPLPTVGITKSWFYYLFRSIIIVLSPLLLGCFYHLIERLIYLLDYSILTSLLITSSVIGLFYFYHLCVFKKKVKKEDSESGQYSNHLSDIYKSIKKEVSIPQKKLDKQELVSKLLLLTLTLTTSSYIYFNSPLHDIKENLKIIVIFCYVPLLLISLIIYSQLKRRSKGLYVIRSLSTQIYQYLYPSHNEEITKHADVNRSYNVDIPVIRHLLLMLNYKNYYYPSNWRKYIWDFTKIVMNYSIATTLLRENKGGNMVFSGKIAFYIFLFFPIILSCVVLLISPAVEVLMNNNDWLKQDVKQIFLQQATMSISFMVVTWITYSEIINHQIWHYFKHPRAKFEANINNYKFGTNEYSYLQISKITEKFLLKTIKKGELIINLLLLGFLPSYITYLSIL
ncbi:hypothetical protein [Alteromonas sp. a30]|uniref:hypothetical protein n=1 Tax=Alteromonas sp. a30 TaxID=2730917 RepID=UPI00227DA522|nr:hypothetical protein [Alteromonas sp. a30]MCY7297178.1 hypothetical protein [Alteromonas sp. a30]